MANPKKIVYSGDPLGGSQKPKKQTETSWDSFHQDNDLKKIILLDINRTYQDKALFHDNAIKESFVNVLYIWAKENSSLSYKQGMNEILAVIFLAFYPFYHSINLENHIECVVAPKKETDSKLTVETQLKQLYHKSLIAQDLQKSIYLFFHNEQEIFADIYFVFDSVMNRGVKELYDTSKLAEKKNQSSKDFASYKQLELFQLQWKKEEINSLSNQDQIPLQRRCNEIVCLKLKVLDSELYEYFNTIDIDCSIFLQRWIKCLFNRELEYPGIFMFWDCIFANDQIENIEGVSENVFNNLNMIDYIAVSMICALKDECKLAFKANISNKQRSERMLPETI